LVPEVVEKSPLLRVAGLSAYYGELRALYDVNLSVGEGDILSIIGANGAGKTTLMKSIVGLMNRGSVAHTRGEITLRRERIDRLGPEQIVDLGVAMVPEGRRLFSRMSVEDNLLAGAFLPRCRAGAQARLEQAYELFPRLAERRRQVVSQMSGGEQQMVAIGRALMSEPSLVLFDELSLGLAPAVVEDIYQTVQRIYRQGVTCVIIEQDMTRALAVATQVCVMLEGTIVLEGTPAELTRDRITAAYFGTEAAS
jgi:branched-chain amino acid transport system ATP-binding protein